LTLSSYQQEQRETYELVVRHVAALPAAETEGLKASCAAYLCFLNDVDDFLLGNFDPICTRECYSSRRSACCQREGIITFFADVVINVLFSAPAEIIRLLSALNSPDKSDKCIYLGSNGCLWRIKPIVCKMFLCDRAKDTVFSNTPICRRAWEDLEQRRKLFTWPDQPVLFDDLEEYFLAAGCRSPLMYLHNSPGLLKVKEKAGKHCD
jgi:hypothetical protein